MNDSTRRLVLLRHASAEPGGVRDEERHLTDAGVHEARLLGRWLKDEGLLGDAVVCSPAMRTRETWAAIQEETGHGVLIAMEPSVYDADVDALLRVVAELDATAPEARTAVLVGHAPGVPQLAHDLCGGRGEGLDVVTHGFVPASAAVLDVAGPWAAFVPGAAQLVVTRPGTDR